MKKSKKKIKRKTAPPEALAPAPVALKVEHKIDRMLADVGCVVDEADLDLDSATDHIKTATKGFYLAGEAFGWDFWRSLRPSTRNALIESATEALQEKAQIMAGAFVSSLTAALKGFDPKELSLNSILHNVLVDETKKLGIEKIDL